MDQKEGTDSPKQYTISNNILQVCSSHSSEHLRVWNKPQEPQTAKFRLCITITEEMVKTYLWVLLSGILIQKLCHKAYNSLPTCSLERLWLWGSGDSIMKCYHKERLQHSHRTEESSGWVGLCPRSGAALSNTTSRGDGNVLYSALPSTEAGNGHLKHLSGFMDLLAYCLNYAALSGRAAFRGKKLEWAGLNYIPSHFWQISSNFFLAK